MTVPTLFSSFCRFVVHKGSNVGLPLIPVKLGPEWVKHAFSVILRNIITPSGLGLAAIGRCAFWPRLSSPFFFCSDFTIWVFHATKVGFSFHAEIPVCPAWPAVFICHSTSCTCTFCTGAVPVGSRWRKHVSIYWCIRSIFCINNTFWCIRSIFCINDSIGEGSINTSTCAR